MEINRFKASDADEIVTWFTSLEDYVLWGGRTFGWPLETASIIERSQEPHVELYTFSASKSYSEPNADSNANSNARDLLGFMEFQRMSNNELRFCRVAIHPNQRGKGLGQSMIESALDAAKKSLMSPPSPWPYSSKTTAQNAATTKRALRWSTKSRA